MVDEQHAGPGRGDVADPLAEPPAVRGVETGGRLVEQQDLRIGDARSGDRHELALALAELSRVPVAQLAEPGALECRGHLTRGGARGRC